MLDDSIGDKSGDSALKKIVIHFFLIKKYSYS